MEHRWGIRTCLARPVRVRSSGALAAPAVLSDISVSGALLQTSAPFALHARLEVQLFPPGSGYSSVEATVVRIGRFGMGVEWTVLAPQSVQRLLSEAAESEAPSDAEPAKYAKAPRPTRAR